MYRQTICHRPTQKATRPRTRIQMLSTNHHLTTVMMSLKLMLTRPLKLVLSIDIRMKRELFFQTTSLFANTRKLFGRETGGESISKMVSCIWTGATICSMLVVERPIGDRHLGLLQKRLISIHALLLPFGFLCHRNCTPPPPAPPIVLSFILLFAEYNFDCFESESCPYITDRTFTSYNLSQICLGDKI